MQNFRLEPYLWIHLAGLAVLPIWFGLCLLGFAVGYPVISVGFEFFLVAIAGIVPILLMQWFRPFYIFSILVVAIRPERLTEFQQKILTRFKTPLNRGLALVISLLLIPGLWQIYRIAPLAADIAPFPSGWRVLGLAIAIVGFLGCNLFAQVPASVLGVLLTRNAEYEVAEPLSVEQIRREFTILGLRVDQILPPLRQKTVLKP